MKVVPVSKEDGKGSGCSHELDTVRREGEGGNQQPPGSKESRIQPRQPFLTALGIYSIYPLLVLHSEIKLYCSQRRKQQNWTGRQSGEKSECAGGRPTSGVSPPPVGTKPVTGSTSGRWRLSPVCAGTPGAPSVTCAGLRAKPAGLILPESSLLLLLLLLLLLFLPVKLLHLSVSARS